MLGKGVPPLDPLFMKMLTLSHRSQLFHQGYSSRHTYSHKQHPYYHNQISDTLYFSFRCENYREANNYNIIKHDGLYKHP